jgi:predicted  nucleic acid-binding Zn-ribbon protein
MGAVRKELKVGENIEDLEPRVVRMETNIVHLVAQNTEIRADLRALNAKVDEKFTRVDERFAAILEKLGELKVWAIIVIGGGVLGIVARAFHWI